MNRAEAEFKVEKLIALSYELGFGPGTTAETADRWIYVKNRRNDLQDELIEALTTEETKR